MNLPLLAGRLASPRYFAVILYVPVEPGVKVTEQLVEEPLPESLHFIALNVPGKLLLNLTFPVGVAIMPDVSVTVAVHVVGKPTGTEEGVQLTEVVVKGVANASTRLLP